MNVKSSKIVLDESLINLLPDFKKLSERGRLLRHVVEVIIELNRFPSKRDLLMIANNRSGFPKVDFFDAIGSQDELIAATKDFCMQFKLYSLAEYCSVEMLNATQNGVVYMFKHDSYYKIGRSNNLDRRTYEIGLQLPFKLELIHVIETANPDKTEKFWHTHFKSKRLNGEWFNLTPIEIHEFCSYTFM